MGPRNYRMDRRRATAEETRRRIVEATLALHSEKGILGTSWKDIAERADVALGTVYRHFPTLEELVPACGELMLELVRPPTLEGVAEVFRGTEELTARVERLLGVFYDFYERGEPYLEVDPRERQMPAVQEWEAEMRSLREAYIREAFRRLADERLVRSLGALLDFPLYQSFRRSGLSRQEAEEVMRAVLTRGVAAEAPGRERPPDTEERR